MGEPVRVQLRRTKGWKMPPNTVVVTRGNGRPYGNPFDFRPSEFCWLALSYGCRGNMAGRVQASVLAYREWVDAGDGKRVAMMERGVVLDGPGGRVDIGPRVAVGPAPTIDDIRRDLRGKNLACWCAIVDRHGNYVPCHADVLLELANRPTCTEIASDA